MDKYGRKLEADSSDLKQLYTTERPSSFSRLDFHPIAPGTNNSTSKISISKKHRGNNAAESEDTTPERAHSEIEAVPTDISSDEHKEEGRSNKSMPASDSGDENKEGESELEVHEGIVGNHTIAGLPDPRGGDVESSSEEEGTTEGHRNREDPGVVTMRRMRTDSDGSSSEESSDIDDDAAEVERELNDRGPTSWDLLYDVCTATWQGEHCLSPTHASTSASSPGQVRISPSLPRVLCSFSASSGYAQSQNVPTGSERRRFAVVNMDWEQVKVGPYLQGRIS